MKLTGCRFLVVSLAVLASAHSVAGCGDSEGGGDATSGAATSGSQSGEEQGGDGDGDMPCEPTLEGVQAAVFDASCSAGVCHGGESPAAGLTLEAGESLGDLLEVASSGCDGWVRVVPGARESSLLYTKLLGTAPCGEQMPLGGALSEAHIECVGAWIDTLEGSDCEKCGGDVCIDLQTDPAHCGACDASCPTGISCEQGVCVCPEGQSACGDACVNLLGDFNHCGSCGNVCANDKVCYMGVCADSCAGLDACDGGCVDLQTDPLNCGACGNVCEAGLACEAGGCDCDATPVSFSADVLPVLLDRCAGMGCHAPPMPRANLDLTAAVAHAELVGVVTDQCGGQRVRVVPGSPDSSYLVSKLNGVDMCFGTQMPKGEAPLTAAERQLISTWICQGATAN